MHYYKFNIADWGLSTAHLTLEEEAIYFRLVNFYYDSESPIPLETQSVLRRLRMGNYEESALQVLSEFFTKTDSGWVHIRCDKVLKDYRKTAKKNKANGAKGGRPPKTKGCKETQIKPSGLPNESQNNPNQEPLTTNQEPLTKVTRASRFAPPSQAEACDYFRDRKAINPDQQAEGFIDFYASKGWMVGKNKMKDWKAAIRNWIKRSGQNERNQSGTSSGETKREATLRQSREDAITIQRATERPHDTSGSILDGDESGVWHTLEHSQGPHGQ